MMRHKIRTTTLLGTCRSKVPQETIQSQLISWQTSPPPSCAYMHAWKPPDVFLQGALFLSLWAYFFMARIVAASLYPLIKTIPRSFIFKKILKINIRNMFEMAASPHHGPLCWGLRTTIINLHALGLGGITHVAVNYLTVEPLRTRSIAAKPN